MYIQSAFQGIAKYLSQQVGTKQLNYGQLRLKKRNKIKCKEKLDNRLK